MTKRFTLPAYQRQIVVSALNHLDPSALAFQGSDAVRAALNDPALRNYLLSWVIPHLTALADGDVPKWMRDSLARDPAGYEYLPQEG